MFSKNENININIMLKQCLDFLTHLFKKGNNYFSCPISLPQYDGMEFGKHNHVKKFTTGVFDLKPSLSNY